VMEDNIHYKRVMNRLFSIITLFLFVSQRDVTFLPYEDKNIKIYRGSRFIWKERFILYCRRYWPF